MSLALPIVDVAPLVRASSTAPERARVAAELDAACSGPGFFYATGHGVDPELPRALERLGRAFFARPQSEKRALRMELAGRAWRGYFGVGDELTSGVPDRKEGLYLGAELGPDDPRVAARTPLFGRNLFPDLPGFRETTLAYLDALTELGHALARGLGAGLGLDPSAFDERLTRDPLVLLRLFHYPPAGESERGWGVAEHTDYGLLTILHQDAVGGLEVRAEGRWREAPPIEDAFVCNVGDMLERLTGGRWRSTAHRVRSPRDAGRVAIAFFFDPSFDAPVRPLPGAPARASVPRWDGEDVHAFEGTYGEYLVRKVARVFPALARELDGPL